MHTEEIKKKKKWTHVFSVFVHFCKQYPSRDHQNTLWQVAKIRDITWEKWMSYEASIMQHCLAWMFFYRKKEERNTFAFWWVICSIIVNTGSVKWLYNMSKLYYKYSHYIHETRVPAFFFFFYALVIWGIFRSIFLSFSPPPFHPLFFSFIPLYFKSIVCVWSEVAGQSVFVPCDLSSFKVSWLWSSQT